MTQKTNMFEFISSSVEMATQRSSYPVCEMRNGFKRITLLERGWLGPKVKSYFYTTNYYCFDWHDCETGKVLEPSKTRMLNYLWAFHFTKEQAQ